MPILHTIRRNFKLDWWGHHGIRHWARVRRNGRIIAQHVAGVDLLVLDLFAVLHDSQRRDGWEDPSHGWRAMAHCRKLHGDDRLGLDEWQFLQLLKAMEHHSEQGVKPLSVTVAACWNADRYDLGRVGIEPDDAYLATGAMLPRKVWWPLHETAINEHRKQRSLHAQKHPHLLPA